MSNNIRSTVFLVDCICLKNIKENRDITKVVALSLSQNIKFSLEQSMAHKLKPSIYFLWLEADVFHKDSTIKTKKFLPCIKSLCTVKIKCYIPNMKA